MSQQVTGESSYPFNSTPGNTMTEVLWAGMMKSVLPTGVIANSTPIGSSIGNWQVTNVLNTLAVSAGTGVSVNVATGEAWLLGVFYTNSIVQNLTLTPNTNATGTRADFIVLDCKWGLDGGVHLMVVEGTPGAVWTAGNGSNTGQPQPPTLTLQQGVEWQFPLAQVNVRYLATQILASDIIDWRMFVSSGTAKSSTEVVACGSSSPNLQANADTIAPSGSLHAEDAINNALQDMYVNYGGGTVQLAEGTFATSNSIVVPSNCNLVGQGANTIIQFQASGGANPVIYVNNQQNITIRDMSITGSGTFNAATPPAIIAGAEGVHIYNSSNVTLENLIINGAKDCGIWLNTTLQPAASYGHQVKGCRITNCYNAGIFTSGNKGVITGNQISNNLIGLVLAGTSTTAGATNNVVNANSIDKNARQGIYIPSGYWVMWNNVSGNIISNNSQQTDNAYNQVSILGNYTQSNTFMNNLVMTTAVKKPLYGIYLDGSCSSNTIMMNDCKVAAKTTANNIACVAGGGTNSTPNYIRFNRSGSVAPNASSYDA